MSLQRTFMMLLSQSRSGTRTFVIPDGVVSYEVRGEFSDRVAFAGLDPENNDTEYEEYRESISYGQSFSDYAGITLTLPNDFMPAGQITSAKLYYRLKCTGTNYGSLPLELKIDNTTILSTSVSSVRMAGNCVSSTITTTLTPEMLNGAELDLGITHPAKSGSMSTANYTLQVYGFKLVIEYE